MLIVGALLLLQFYLLNTAHLDQFPFSGSVAQQLV